MEKSIVSGDKMVRETVREIRVTHATEKLPGYTSIHNNENTVEAEMSDAAN